MSARHLYEALIAVAVLLADRLSKALVARNIPLNGAGIDVVPGLFRITHVENQGAAFGIFAESTLPWKTLGLAGMSLVAMVVMIYLLWKSSQRLDTAAVGLSLILGGAAGNFWDRIIRGRVVDFLHFYVRGYSWPDFNVADSAIVVGAVLLIADIIFSRPQPVRAE